METMSVRPPAVELAVLAALNVGYLWLLVYLPRRVFRVTKERGWPLRFSLSSACFAIGLLQASSLLGYSVIPAYAILLAYMFAVGAQLVTFLRSLGLQERGAWYAVVMLQAPAFGVLGYLLGIAAEKLLPNSRA
jgi:hypothetical protein